MKILGPFMMLLLATSAVAEPGSAAAAKPTKPAAKPAWVYQKGRMNWEGDWSFGVDEVDYRDKAAAPIEGPFDIAISGRQWGGWQPFFSLTCQSQHAVCFDTTPYKFLIFSGKGTVAHQIFQVGFMSPGDKPDGPVIMVSQYCSGGSDLEVGKWTSCKIPLSAFKLIDTKISKFWIQDQTGLTTNKWYLDDVGFTPD
ncbi:MAG TPA: hypothetical protein VGI90_12330 [Steroidobacteraceae bacterium]|jgi:hypothetical protein